MQSPLVFDYMTNWTIVSTFLKGVYLSRPQTLRYKCLLDVSLLTKYSSSIGPLKDLSLKDLTIKTVMLCSLVCAQREQTLSLLDINNQVFIKDVVKFVISDHHKTSKPGKT